MSCARETGFGGALSSTSCSLSRDTLNSLEINYEAPNQRLVLTFGNFTPLWTAVTIGINHVDC